MNVVQICFCYPPIFSGYGRQLCTINNYLEDNFFKEVNITVLTAFRRGPDERSSYLRVKSMFPCDRPNGWRLSLLFYIFSFFYPVFFLKDILKADVIHVVKAGPEALVAILFAWILKKPVIIKVAQDEVGQKVGAFSVLRKVRLWSLKFADRIVAISSLIKNDLLSIGVRLDRIVEISNAVNVEKFNGELIGTSEKVRITYVGAISRRKGVDVLLAALSKLANVVGFVDQYSVKMVGPDYGSIPTFLNEIQELKNLGLDIEYLGETDRVESVLLHSDVLILPSVSEGMPNVVLEAFSMGLPVIMSDIPVSNDLISSHCGIVFPVGDIAGLAESIQSFKTVNFDANKIRLNAIKKYSVNVVSRKYLELYVELSQSIKGK